MPSESQGTKKEKRVTTSITFFVCQHFPFYGFYGHFSCFLFNWSFRVFFSKISAILTPRTMIFWHKDYFSTKEIAKKIRKNPFLRHFSCVFSYRNKKNDVFVMKISAISAHYMKFFSQFFYKGMWYLGSEDLVQLEIKDFCLLYFFENSKIQFLSVNGVIFPFLLFG